MNQSVWHTNFRVNPPNSKLDIFRDSVNTRPSVPLTMMAFLKEQHRHSNSIFPDTPTPLAGRFLVSDALTELSQGPKLTVEDNADWSCASYVLFIMTAAVNDEQAGNTAVYVYYLLYLNESYHPSVFGYTASIICYCKRIHFRHNVGHVIRSSGPWTKHIWRFDFKIGVRVRPFSSMWGNEHKHHVHGDWVGAECNYISQIDKYMRRRMIERRPRYLGYHMMYRRRWWWISRITETTCVILNRKSGKYETHARMSTTDSNYRHRASNDDLGRRDEKSRCLSPLTQFGISEKSGHE